MRRGPEVYTEGLGEVIRGMRMYCGIGRVEMARRLGMASTSFSEIENGRRPCPPNFLTSLQYVVDAFDADVRKAINSQTRLRPNSRESGSWYRSVCGRAAVLDPSVEVVLDRTPAKVQG